MAAVVGRDAGDGVRVGVGGVGLVAGLGGDQPVLGPLGAGEREHRLDERVGRRLVEPRLAKARDEPVPVECALDLVGLGRAACLRVVVRGEQAVEGRRGQLRIAARRGGEDRVEARRR